MTTTTYRIHHTHGTAEGHDTWADTWAALVAVYGGDIYAADPHGWPCDGDSTPDLSCGRAMVWSDAESSENDDGARAIATVYEVYKG